MTLTSWPTRRDYLLSTCYETGGEMWIFWGFMGCVCNIVIINEQFGTTYLSILVNERFSTFRTEPSNLSLCNTLQFLQEAKENILYAKVFPLWKIWSSLCSSSAVFHCGNTYLKKYLGFGIFHWLMSEVIICRTCQISGNIVSRTCIGFRMLCYKRWQWNCSVSPANMLAISKLKMWVKYSSCVGIMW